MTKHERYNRSPKGLARYARYRSTDKGRANARRGHAALRFKEREARINEIKELLT